MKIMQIYDWIAMLNTLCARLLSAGADARVCVWRLDGADGVQCVASVGRCDSY